VEIKAVELDVVVVASLRGVAWPAGLPQLAATSDITTLMAAYETRRDFFFAVSTRSNGTSVALGGGVMIAARHSHHGPLMASETEIVAVGVGWPL
jgi:hypothetical protein